ncbi:MAG: solute:sodium symporter family transporter [Kiritimatiellae bacterium]|nr:solute:sodium symporter family transporter [Kiritimatiellia bacterium]
MFLTLASFLFFTALVAGITWWKSRGGVGADSGSGFFLAGRSLTFPFIAFSLLLTNLSTEQLVGLNGQGFTTGLAVMMWEVVAVVAIVLMALFFLPKFLKSGITTVPELLDIRFGGVAQLVCNVLFLLAYIFILLPMILYTGAKGMSGILDLKALTGIQNDTVLLWGVIWLIGLIGTGYAIFGGLKSIVISDLLNGIGLLAGGFMITFFGLGACGKIDLDGGAALGGSVARGWTNLVRGLPDHMNSIAGEGSQAPFFEIFTGVMLINTFYWCTNQQIIQRTLAASSLKEGQKGVLLCGLLKLIGPLYLILPGIMAYFLFRHGAIVPSSAAVVDKTTGLLTEANAYGELVRTVLPPYLAGFFAAAMIGAVLSSFNSALNSTCTLFSMGIYRKLFPEAEEKRAVAAGKRFGLVLAIAAMSLSPFLDVIPSIFGYLQKMNAIYFIPILAVVLLGLVSRRAKQATAVFGMVAGVVAIASGYFLLPLFGEKWDLVSCIGEYDFVGLCFLAIFDLMLLWRLVSPSGKAHEFHDAKAVDLTPWGGAKWASLAMLAVIVAIYAYFADFSPLRIAGKVPWGAFSAKWCAAVLPTVALVVLDRCRE